MDKAERVGTGFKRIKDILEKEELPFPEIESDTFCIMIFKRSVLPPSFFIEVFCSDLFEVRI